MVKQSIERGDFMEHRIKKREARLVDSMEGMDYWECNSCGEHYDDIIISRAEKVSKCYNCGNNTWNIIKVYSPVRKIVWETK